MLTWHRRLLRQSYKQSNLSRWYSAGAPRRSRIPIHLPRLPAYRFLERIRVFLLAAPGETRDWQDIWAERVERHKEKQQQRAEMPKAPKAGHYAVRTGRKPGIYATWAECEEQVKGYPNAQFKKFPTRSAAESFIGIGSSSGSASTSTAPAQTSRSGAQLSNGNNHSNSVSSDSSATVPLSPLAAQAAAEGFDIAPSGHLVVHTDGAARGNGQVGSVAGLGVWWGSKGKARELNLAEALPGPMQTNNRAELLAIIRAVETCPYPDLPLEIRTDSSYSIKAMTVYLSNWMSRNWRTSTGEPVKNKEMIVHLVALMNRRGRGAAGPAGVKFTHVRGHCGVAGNEEADQLANRGAEMPRVADRTDWLTLEDAEREHVELARNPETWAGGKNKMDIECDIDPDAFFDDHDEDVRQLEREIAASS